MIVKAAVMLHDVRQDKDIIIPCHRHCDAYFILKEFGYTRQDYQVICEGFLDEHDNFLNRGRTWREAQRCN